MVASIAVAMYVKEQMSAKALYRHVGPVWGQTAKVKDHQYYGTSKWCMM